MSRAYLNLSLPFHLFTLQMKHVPFCISFLILLGTVNLKSFRVVNSYCMFSACYDLKFLKVETSPFLSLKMNICIYSCIFEYVCMYI